MVIADIFNKANLESVSVASTGSSVNISRLSRKSIFVNTVSAQSGTATTDVTVNIEASPDESTWFNLDSKAYASGTAAGTDVFSYNSHFPYMRTTTTNVTPNSGASTVSTTIVGRGI